MSRIGLEAGPLSQWLYAGMREAGLAVFGSPKGGCSIGCPSRISRTLRHANDRLRQVMWRDVAPRVASRHTVVCADLRGYGRTSCPPSADDHSPYGKRTMAKDLLAVMEQLGFPQKIFGCRT
jgi:pimeloyl-ACP methyl ester carboxylesterase